ncbi:hypothetical protein BDF21DRAFT_450267 [Thamnidium elegans]|nr:hypothetical protein BDF21DRAFT_450267 [Thamnidium elegans]
MANVYDFHQHTYCVVLYIKDIITRASVIYTSTREYDRTKTSSQLQSCITYDIHKLNVLSYGEQTSSAYNRNNKDTVLVDRFMERLHQLFKKDKNSWDQDDLFSLKAISDFIRLVVKKLMNILNEESDGINVFHYVFILPSDWEEEIKEVLIRPLFVQANLILKDDHKDRLLFCSDIESICYRLTNWSKLGVFLERGKDTIICRLIFNEQDQVLIKMDLISVANPLFDHADSILFPKVVRSNSFSLTRDDINNAIREFLKIDFSFIVKKKIKDIVMKSLSESEDTDLMKPLIISTDGWKLDKRQKAFVESLCFFDICKETSKARHNTIKDLLLNNVVKDYSLMIFIDQCSSKVKLDLDMLNWSKYMLEYYRISFNDKITVHEINSLKVIDHEIVTVGAGYYAFDAIYNSDIYCRPRIIENPATSSSIFLKSKPNAILNLDISLESTLLSFSLLDENGLIKQIWKNDYFVTDISLRSLGSFFKFSEVLTLTITHSFITLMEKYIVGYSGNEDELEKSIMADTETIFNIESNTKDLLVSTQHLIYITLFKFLYITYIKKIVTRKLVTIAGCNVDTKIGYAITIEKNILNCLFGTKEDLEDDMYTCGLIDRNDDCKKLRITTQGEDLLPVIQKYSKVHFPLKSFFLIAQLHETYIQLTLNQVVTESSLNDDGDQEAIILQDEIIYIRNIYDSLCLNMWNNIVEDNSLIQLCDTHNDYNERELLEIFSFENEIEFTSNLKQYIFNNILHKTSILQFTDKIAVNLSASCSCRVYLTVYDITEISFRPVLQDIIFVVFTSLINKQLFGNYTNIQCLFHLICFNYNLQFQLILMKVLKDETDQFMYEQEIDTPYYIIPKLPNQLFQHALQQRPFSYKGFKVGILHHVYSENYCFNIGRALGKNCCLYKNMRYDIKTIEINDEVSFLLLKKGDIISSGNTSRVFYLISQDNPFDGRIRYFKSKKMCNLRPDTTITFEDTAKMTVGPIIRPKESKSGQEIPVIISTVYKGYSFSLSLAAKTVGEEMKVTHLTKFAEPMTLARF